MSMTPTVTGQLNLRLMQEPQIISPDTEDNETPENDMVLKKKSKVFPFFIIQFLPNW